MGISVTLKYSAIQRRLRDEWFEQVETSADEWEEKAPMGEGESASMRVVNRVTGMQAVAKPGLSRGSDTAHCRAAHEKLAYDLSCLLALPVCPVVLWGNGAPDQYKRGRSISAWAFPGSEKWSVAESRGLITATQTEGEKATFAAMRVFHTWIGDSDRRLDHVHFDLNSPDTEAIAAFYDHGHSMSLHWQGPNDQINPSPICLPNSDLRDVMGETATHIAAHCCPVN
jgi:hypothetical protein